MASAGDYAKIRNDCSARGVLYEDPDFLTENSNLFYHQPPPGVNFQWKRPNELCRDPKFVIDNPKQFDIVQGQYGDPWFVSSTAILQQYRGLFYRSVPADQGFTGDFHYAGIFHFRFWWCGEWVEVVVDDRLPVVDGRLAFVQSAASDQFWASLLEKAYAKLHGSYEAIKYTCSGDVMSELSGGSTEVIVMNPEQDLMGHLLHALGCTTICTAVADSEAAVNVGICRGFNYSILSLDEVMTLDGNMIRLVRLRNPPKSPVFNGPWARVDAPEWKRIANKERSRLNIDADAIQNEAFWMTIPDFRTYFGRLELVHLDADTCQSENKFRSLGAQPPNTKLYQGAWKKGTSAGGCRNHLETFHINPQILLGVAQKAPVLVAVLQHQIQEPRVIGFSIYKAPIGQPSNQLVNSVYLKTNKAVHHSTFSNSRQVVERVILDAGAYIVIPSTYDVGQEGGFTVRIYSNAAVTLGALDFTPTIVKSPIVKAQEINNEYRGMFMAFADEKETVNAFELQELLHACLPNDYMKSSASLDVCRRIIHAFQMNQQIGRVGYKQFTDFICSLKMWQEIFSHHSKSSSGVMHAEKLREALSDVGMQLSADTLQLVMLRYMKRDAIFRFGDFVQCILHLIAAFNGFSRKDLSGSGQIKLGTSDISNKMPNCCGDLCLILISFVLSPLSVVLLRGCGKDFAINVLLFILGIIPGILHAWYLICCAEPPIKHRV